MTTSPIIRSIFVRFDVGWRQPGVFLYRTLADLLTGCGCSACAARAAQREPRTVQPRPVWMSTEMQLMLYGYAAIEREVVRFVLDDLPVPDEGASW